MTVVLIGVEEPEAEGAGVLGRGRDRSEISETEVLEAARGTRLLPVADGRGGPVGQGGFERPVSVDESGRRSRRFRRTGKAVALACAVYTVVIVVTLLSGNSEAPWLPVPGQNDAPPASRVDISPRPSDPARPPGSGHAEAPPGAPATAGGGKKPASGSVTSAPRTPAGTAKPAGSADPRPTDTTTAEPPGSGATDPAVQPSPPPVSVSPDPSAISGGGPSPDPTPSQGGSVSATPRS